MITNYQGTVICGSGDLQVSVAETEVLNGRYVNLELQNDDDCYISLNGGSYMFIRANQGIAADVVYSLKFLNSGKTFNWIGTKA